MNITRVDELLKEIDDTISNIEKTQFSTLECDYLAKFLAVFISGTYEECIKDIITKKIFSSCSPEGVFFIEKYLYEHFRNPTITNIGLLLSKFNLQWKDEFDSIQNVLKRGVDLIVSNKNFFAHGQTFNITLRETIEAHQKGKEVIKKLQNIILSPLYDIQPKPEFVT